MSHNTNIDEAEIEIGRRLAAAAISYQMGISYQTAYKRYAGNKTIGPFWIELAKLVRENFKNQ